MKTGGFLFAATLLGLCATAYAQDIYDPAESQSLAEWVEALLPAFPTGTIEQFEVDDAEIVFWDFGDSGSLELRGPDAWHQLQERLQGHISRGVTWTLPITEMQCHARNGMGYCTVSHDSVVQLNGQPMPTTHWRVTLVARLVDGTWHLLHFHSSLVT